MYLVAVQENKPEEVMALMREGGLRAEVRACCDYPRDGGGLCTTESFSNVCWSL